MGSYGGISFGPTTATTGNNEYASVINLIPLIHSTSGRYTSNDETITNITFSLPLTSTRSQSYDLSVLIFNKFDISATGASWSSSEGSKYWNYNYNNDVAHYIHKSSSVASYGFHNGGRINSSAASTIEKIFPDFNSSGVLASFTFGNIGTKNGNFILNSSNAISKNFYKTSIKDWTWSAGQGTMLGIGVYETEGYDYTSSSTQHALRWQEKTRFGLTIETSTGSIRYNNNGIWTNCVPYYLVNGEWKQCAPYCYQNGWKQIG